MARPARRLPHRRRCLPLIRPVLVCGDRIVVDMEIEFANDELKDLINDPEKLKEKVGEEAADKIGQAILALSEADSLSDIDELLDDSEQPEDDGPMQTSVRQSNGLRQIFSEEGEHSSTSRYH